MTVEAYWLFRSVILRLCDVHNRIEDEIAHVFVEIYLIIEKGMPLPLALLFHANPNLKPAAQQ